MTLSKEHCARVLNEWAAYYVKNAEVRSRRAESNLNEEYIQLRIAKAVEEERHRHDPYEGVGGFGEPTAEQRFEETLKRMKLEAETASRELQNNRDMVEYIKSITS